MIVLLNVLADSVANAACNAATLASISLTYSSVTGPSAAGCGDEEDDLASTSVGTSPDERKIHITHKIFKDSYRSLCNRSLRQAKTTSSDVERNQNTNILHFENNQPLFFDL